MIGYETEGNTVVAVALATGPRDASKNADLMADAEFAVIFGTRHDQIDDYLGSGRDGQRLLDPELAVAAFVCGLGAQLS